MKHEVKEIKTDADKDEIRNFFNAHWGTAPIHIEDFFQYDRFSHVITVTQGNEVIAMLPVIKSDPKRDYGQLTDNHYQFCYVLIHTDYRNQGFCNRIVRMGIKLMIEVVGADHIRCSKSSKNLVRHELLTDMNFGLLKFNPGQDEFRHIYELKSNEVINKWREYEAV